MSNYFSEDFQYDSCVARGICSISPKNSALQTVIVLYLRICAKYLVKFVEKKEIKQEFKIFLLNTLSSLIFNPDIDEAIFCLTVQKFRQIIPKIIDDFSEVFPNEEIEGERKNVFELFDKTSDIISAIKYGEYIFKRSQEVIKSQIRDLYSIMLMLSKGISVKTLEINNYDDDFNKGFKAILRVLDKINLREIEEKSLIQLIKSIVLVDVDASKVLRNLQEEKYGKQVVSEVSYTTYPGKAVLVVGSNLRELEEILIAFSGLNVDIYTHDEMMLAYTFPKLLEYKKLRGQFGQGLENCLLDFATFPGPIILTKHSLHNIENFYRGNLFTTDYVTPKGIIRIDNGDYSKVIDVIKLSKGFKTGKVCETVLIGFDYDDVIQNITRKIETGKYKQILFIGLEVYSIEQNTYFEKLIKHLHDDVLIISFSYKFEQQNFIHINTCFDFFSIIKIYDYVKKFNLWMTIFIPKCNRESLSQMIYFILNEKTEVYIGKCIPMIINPSLLSTLERFFSIKFITSVKNDIESILKK